MDFKNIHIGSLIRQEINEKDIATSRVCNFMNCTENEIEEMLGLKSLDSETLLKWCKLLEYDFFRMYSHHLILYSPDSSSCGVKKNAATKSSLPNFRKNIYTKEIIDFILEMIESGEKTKRQVIEQYRIPKTTLHKWINKYNNLKS